MLNNASAVKPAPADPVSRFTTRASSAMVKRNGRNEAIVNPQRPADSERPDACQVVQLTT